MKELSNHNKRLLIDYCIGNTDETESNEAKKLISSNEEAAKVYSNLKKALSPLDCWGDEKCPDELFEVTINRLNNAARASQLHLQQLLETEQARTVKIGSMFWHNVGTILATAAVIMFAASVIFPSLNFARHRYWQHCCQAQLQRIGQAFKQYTADHDGRLPSVATSAGAPWWKVGYQGKENHSNTRHIWLLVKNGYIEPTDFVCPAKSQKSPLDFGSINIQHYCDFPARRYVTYSFRIMGSKAVKGCRGSRSVLISDMNPVFENLPQNFSRRQLQLVLDKTSLSLNSPNHRGKGQNVLFRDGSVEFTGVRNIGPNLDDIFTLKNTTVYNGCEIPSCETDAFLAP